MKLSPLVHAAALALAISAPNTLAADADGRFAVKSVGGTKCSTFVDAVKAKDQNRVALFIGWVAGYLSAANQMEAETFDLASWQDMRTLASFLNTVCDRNADLRFGAATAQMINVLKKDRLTVRSDTISASHDGNEVTLYQEAMRRAQAALSELGMYSGELNGQFSDPTRDALLRFQAEQKLPESGVPDQRTLVSLFRAVNKKP